MKIISNPFIQWLMLKNIDVDMNDIFSKMGYKTIAIYGCSQLCVPFIEELKNNKDIEIKYFIDKNPENSHFLGYPVLKFGDIDYIDDVEMVLLTVPDLSLCGEIFNKTNAKLVFINALIEILYKIYFGYREVQKLMAQKNANFIYSFIPTALTTENPSEYEIRLQDLTYPAIHINNLHYRIESMLPAFDFIEDIDCKYVMELMSNMDLGFYRDCKTSDTVINKQTLFGNIVNNYRLVVDTPKEYDNTIYLCGVCMAFGVYAEDKHSIGSFLQAHLNSSLLNNKKYKVAVLAPVFYTKEELLDYVQSLDLKEGDCVMYFDFLFGVFETKSIGYVETVIGSMENMQCIDLQRLFNRPHNLGQIFVDYCHMTGKAYKVAAEEIYKRLTNIEASDSNEAQEKSVQKTTFDSHIISETRKLPNSAPANDIFKNNKEFSQYLEDLDKIKQTDKYKNIGAIIMNCNPFTLGHRYLIEQASSQVDLLYIFLVSEDKSFFSFDDRLDLVIKGTADLKNVIILPSGKFVLSNITFADYFSKENITKTVDPSIDVKLFARDIAPVLGIKKRFVGNEPYCQVTNMYNESMRIILPKYDIEYVEIERKEQGLEPISASRVRKLLKDKNFDDIAKIVPKITLDYLIELYKE